MSPHAATFTEALDAFEFFAGWAGGIFPVRVGALGDDVVWTRSGLKDVVRHYDERFDTEISVGLPQARVNAGGVTATSVLWARIEGSDQLKRARAFRPLPTLVIQEGGSSRRLLVWALERELSWSDAVRANRRIAYRLRAVQKWSDPDLLWVPAPGTCLREGRSRPVAVRVGRVTADSFRARQVVGGLKDPPEAKWWDKAAA